VYLYNTINASIIQNFNLITKTKTYQITIMKCQARKLVSNNINYPPNHKTLKQKTIQKTRV